MNNEVFSIPVMAQYGKLYISHARGFNKGLHETIYPNFNDQNSLL